MQSSSSLADIRAFVTIAQQGSFTKAAEVLQSSRAHVSRQLAQLEQQLGVQLIVRTTRAQRLTPVQHREPIPHRQSVAHVMGDEHHRHALLAHLVDGCQDV